MKKILSTKPLYSSIHNYFNSLEMELTCLDIAGPIEQLDLIHMLSDYDGMVSMLSDTLNYSFFEQLPPSIKAVANYAVGHNNMDLAAAKEFNIPVSNTPDVLTDATAGMAFALMNACSRRLVDASRQVQNNEWVDWNPTGFLGLELKGKTLGILGAGRIGQSMAKMCKGAFDMNVLYSARTTKNLPEYEAVNLTTLLEKSDVLSVHCDLNESTKGILGKEEFLKMKEQAIYINTARGEIHREDQLIEVLSSGHLFGVGLDVTEVEPLPHDSKLGTFDNVIITPHIGSATTVARTNMGKLCADNLRAAFDGKPMPNQIN